MLFKQLTRIGLAILISLNILSLVTMYMWSGTILNILMFLISGINVVLVLVFAKVGWKTSILALAIVFLSFFERGPMIPDLFQVTLYRFLGKYPNECRIDTVDATNEVLICDQKDLFGLSLVRTVLFQSRGKSLQDWLTSGSPVPSDVYDLGKRTGSKVVVDHTADDYYVIYTDEDGIS